jgi:hypothetical protein
MEERQLFSSFTLAYRGNDADLHQLDAAQTGKSITGTAKLYNSVLHFYFHGQVPARNYRPYIRTYTRAPAAGSLDLIFLAATVYDQLNAYPPVLQKVVEFIFPKLLSAIFAKRTHRSDEMIKALEIIQEQSLHNHELAKTAIGAIISDKAQLYGLIDRLIENNRTAMAEMVAPVGTGCKTMTHFDKTPAAETIDEPLAEVMRSQEELEVGSQTQFEGVILGVDKITGACRIRLAETGLEIRGKITDPALRAPHNVYTSALDTASGVILTAKPILKYGELSKLFISDAVAR